MRLRHTRRNLLCQPSAEHPTHTGIEVPGVVEMIPEDVLRIDKQKTSLTSVKFRTKPKEDS